MKNFSPQHQYRSNSVINKNPRLALKFDFKELIDVHRHQFQHLSWPQHLRFEHIHHHVFFWGCFYIIFLLNSENSGESLICEEIQDYFKLLFPHCSGPGTYFHIPDSTVL